MENMKIMNRTNLLFLSVLLILPVSCKREYPKNTLPQNIYSNARTLQPEWELAVGRKTNVYIFQDSILISDIDEKEAASAGYFMEVFNIHTGDTVETLLPYGAAQGKLLGATFYPHGGDTLLVYDYVKRSVYIVDLRQFASGVSGRAIYGKSTNISTQYILPYGNRLLCQNPYCFNINVKKYTNNGNRYILSDTSYSYTETSEYSYNTINVVRGVSAINWTKGKIFYADAFRNLIEIHGTDLSLLSYTVGPEHFLPSYTEYRYSPEAVGLVFYGDIPETYTAIASSDNAVYLAYSGNKITSDFNRNNFTSYIMTFDWDGRCTDVFKTDLYIKTLSLSADESRIYAYGQSSKSEYALQKFVLNN